HRSPELAELRTPVIDGRQAHGPQDAIGDRTGPGDLEEVSAGGMEVERGHGGSVRTGWIACKMPRGEFPMSSAPVSPSSPVRGTTLPADEVRAALARRLRAETRGEVLFDTASRGRYATDASIYQIMPVGVFVPSCDEDIAVALQVARELGVPVLPRG